MIVAPMGIPRVLSIAGTDPTGGAGIQADIKAITAAGGFAYSVVTSLVAQNTTGVQEIFTPPISFLKAQLSAVADDVAIDAVKIGMLGSTAVTEPVAKFVQQLQCPVVLDPVMVASSGDRLLEPEAEAAVRDLARHTTLITPNLPELAVLGETPVATTIEEAIAQATDLAAKLQVTVLMKGGHLEGQLADNAVICPDGSLHRIPVHKVRTSNTHGTGCSLSSALATKLGAGWTPAEAADWATRWLYESILHADELHIGRSNGPVDHSHTARRMQAAASTQPWLRSTAAPTQAFEPAAGKFTARMWEICGPYLTEIMELPFIEQLRRGTLRREDFQFYVEQDSLYLVRYADALRALGGEWAEDAEGTIAAEQHMHTKWLSGCAIGMSPVTQAYTDFLLATVHSTELAVGQAAVLPCYWLYNELALRLADSNFADNPYFDWLGAYSGTDFTDATAAALSRVERELQRYPDLLEPALQACATAARYELEFFAQADRAWVIPATERS